MYISDLNCHIIDEISCYGFILRFVFITETFICVVDILWKFIFFPGSSKIIYTRGL